MKPLKKDTKITLLIISLIAGFVFLVSFSTYYVSDTIHKGNICGCAIPIPLILVASSSLGVFVGSGIYYLLSSKFNQKEKYPKNFKAILKFLDQDERKVIKTLIQSQKPIHQSELSRETNLNKVKISRLIKKLVEKEVIIKREERKVNYISLHEDLKKVFV